MAQMIKDKYTTAIILAAGIGSRFSSSIPKQKISILGKSIIRRVAEPFFFCNEIDSIVVVTRAEDVDFVNCELRFLGKKLYATIPGGKCRAESAMLGFCAIPPETTHVAIHDGARCLITSNDISSVVCAAHNSGAASAVSEVVSTVKKISGNNIVETIPREELVFAETPQVFSCEIYKEAISSNVDMELITDDNMLVESIGKEITAVVLSEENPKITYSKDIDYAEFIIERRERMLGLRIGQGYDAHKLVENRKLVLGGVEIPYEKGLLGHSDADVLVHAIMDAILGAMSMGDIGKMFPDTSEEFRGISSLKLLARVGAFMRECGFELVNIDSTVVLQRPKISPHIENMRKNIADSLSVDVNSISVKATTEENMGYTGSGEGAKAMAIVLIAKK